jgi:hypothetical protein
MTTCVGASGNSSRKARRISTSSIIMPVIPNEVRNLFQTVPLRKILTLKLKNLCYKLKDLTLILKVLSFELKRLNTKLKTLCFKFKFLT